MRAVLILFPFSVGCCCSVLIGYRNSTVTSRERFSEDTTTAFNRRGTVPNMTSSLRGYRRNVWVEFCARDDFCSKGTPHQRLFLPLRLWVAFFMLAENNDDVAALNYCAHEKTVKIPIVCCTPSRGQESHAGRGWFNKSKILVLLSTIT